MEVIQFKKNHPDVLKNFLDGVSERGSRPVLYIGLDEDGHPVLHTMEGLTWKELSYVKMALDMHFIKDWNS